MRFHVPRKQLRRGLHKEIPRTVLVRLGSKDIVRVATDVVEAWQAPSLHAAFGSGSGLVAFGELGTCGLIVRDRNARVYALTCSHVVAPWWSVPKGARVDERANSTTGPQVGTVADWTVLDPTNQNTADAALVALDSSGWLPSSQTGVSGFAGPLSDDAHELFEKEVRILTTHGALDGIVNGVANDLVVMFGGRNFMFSDVISYHAAVEPGDSGSVVLDAEDQAIGLHFAGEPAGGTGYCIEIAKILQAFQAYDLSLV